MTDWLTLADGIRVMLFRGTRCCPVRERKCNDGRWLVVLQAPARSHRGNVFADDPVAPDLFVGLRFKVDRRVQRAPAIVGVLEPEFVAQASRNARPRSSGDVISNIPSGTNRGD